jgi:hypothetical protein
MDHLVDLQTLDRLAPGPISSGMTPWLCNTAVEFGPEDPSGAGFIQ